MEVFETWVIHLPLKIEIELWLQFQQFLSNIITLKKWHYLPTNSKLEESYRTTYLSTTATTLFFNVENVITMYV